MVILTQISRAREYFYVKYHENGAIFCHCYYDTDNKSGTEEDRGTMTSSDI